MLVDEANIWRFRVHGSETVYDYRVTGNYICDNTQTALELARNNLGIVFAPKESLKKSLRVVLWFPASRIRKSGGST